MAFLDLEGLRRFKNKLDEKFSLPIEAIRSWKPSSNGRSGQILRSNGDGTTSWQDAASAQDVASAVDSWMDDHISPNTAIALDTSLTSTTAAAQGAAAGNMVLVTDSQPSENTNKVWLKKTPDAEILIPTMDDYDAVVNSVSDAQEAINATGGVLDIQATYSKNLNKTPYPDTYTSKGVTFTHNADGSMSMSGTPTGSIFWPMPTDITEDRWLLPAGTYTISGGRNKMVVRVLLFANKTDTTAAVDKASGTSTETFTTDRDYWAFIRFDILVDSSPNGVTLYPQIESGSSATQYQSPYDIQYDSHVIESIHSDIDRLDVSAVALDDKMSKYDNILDVTTVASKNLNKTPYPDQHTQSGVTFTRNDDGSMLMSGTPTGDIFWPQSAEDGKWFLPAGTYTVSGGRNKMVVDLLLFADKADTSPMEDHASGTNSDTFTTHRDYWAWVRFNILRGSAPDGLVIYHQVEAGDTATEYQSPDSVTYVSNLIDGLIDDVSVIDGLEESVDTLSDVVTDITEQEVGKNLVDPHVRTTGFIYANGTITTESSYADYSTSDFIPLKENTDYAFGVFLATTGAHVVYARVVALLFDENKTPITESYQNISTGGVLTFNSGATAKFARVCAVTNYCFQLESGRTTPSTYEEYHVSNLIGCSLGETPINQVDNAIRDTLDGIGVVSEVVGVNKVDPSKLVVGHIQANGTIAKQDAYGNYLTSEYIPLEPNTDYVFSNYSTSGNIRTSQSVTCALFDNSRTVISGSYQNVSGVGYLTFNSGENAKFVRVTTKNDSLFQLEEGRITPSPYVEYESHNVMSLQLGDEPIGQVQERIDYSINNSGLVQYEEGKNLVNPDKLEQGYIMSNGRLSTVDAYANYSTSDYIALEPNTDYAFTGFSATTHVRIDYNRVACLLFDDAKAPVSGTYQDLSSAQSSGKLTFNSGSNAKFARVTTRTGALFQLESGVTEPTICEEYSGKYVSGYPLGKIPFAQSQSGNILYGKKWAVCGDSFTDGATNTYITDDGIYKGSRYVYPYLIGNRNDMKILRFFNGGETLAYPASPGSFDNSLTYPGGERYYQNIPADVDYITIYLGINDANHASGHSQDGEDTTGYIPLGEITDNTTASYYGAWNVVLTWLITNRPHAHIGIIVCNGISSTDAYRQAQIAIAQKYGIPYMDLNGDERTPSMHRTCNPNIASAVKDALLTKWSVSSSNSHPNDAAHLFESTFIENFLRGL